MVVLVKHYGHRVMPNVYNPAFDVTPAKLITGWVLDTGVYHQSQVLAGELKKLI